MTIRELQNSEWEKVAEVYRSQGDVLPPAEQNRLIVAESDGAVVGLCGLNLVAHVGPLWVAPKCRGFGLAGQMVGAVEDLIRQAGGAGYLTFPSNDSSVRVMEKLGLTPAGWKVYRREF